MIKLARWVSDRGATTGQQQRCAKGHQCGQALLRARNRGYYVRGSRNALRAYYVPVACTYWARNALRAQYVPSTCP
eukprot:scaffold57920_cov42-Phaeocystis_antarctica.AAC.2